MLDCTHDANGCGFCVDDGVNPPIVIVAGLPFGVFAGQILGRVPIKP